MLKADKNITDFNKDFEFILDDMENEFKKNKPEIPIVSVNASKKDYNEIIEKYGLEFTPTYVLVDNNAEKIYKRVGNFKLEKFTSLTT